MIVWLAKGAFVAVTWAMGRRANRAFKQFHEAAEKELKQGVPVLETQDTTRTGDRR